MVVKVTIKSLAVTTTTIYRVIPVTTYSMAAMELITYTVMSVMIAYMANLATIF